MKPIAICLAPFCLLLLSVTATGTAAQEQQTASAPSPVAIVGATIAEWRGDVHVNLPGRPFSNPLRGEKLPVGTTLDTGSGRLLLRLNDGSELLVRPHTKLQLQQPSLADPTYFQLLLGRIRALINKRTGGAVPFELGTPSAVIAVRGTEFDVEVSRHSVTEVDVIEGLVEVSGRNPAWGFVLLEPGFSTRVGLDSGPEQPEPTNEMRPEVERPGPRENETDGKSELESEFRRGEGEQEVEIRESAESEEREMQEIREMSDQTASPAEAGNEGGGSQRD